ncbi:MAG: DUF4176 domain-containing protein [Clostridiales bacterium]
MENKTFDFTDSIKKLLSIWLMKKNFLNNNEKKFFFNIGCRYLNNVDTLYSVNEIILTGKEHLKDDTLVFSIEKNEIEIKNNSNSLKLDLKLFRNILIGMIDILETMYPLGTVVELKKEFFINHIQIEKVNRLLIIITKRFLYKENEKSYFPYAGIVYPIGDIKQNEVLHFTSPLIENIVHKGYSDIQDEAYIYFMKKELIIKNSMHSYSFSTKEELEKLARKQNRKDWNK